MAEIKADFCLAIDFEKGSKNPSRIFRVMSELIDACHFLDTILVQSIDVKIEPIVVLEDIEIGSLRTWLRQVLETTDDQALKNLDWKPIVGSYLVQAKQIVVKFLEGKTEITDRNQIKELNENLLLSAEETNVMQIPAYSPIPREKLLEGVERISKALEPLDPQDKASFVTNEITIGFNASFQYLPQKIEDLLIEQTIESKIWMILKIKKPDYLGESMWEVRHDQRNFQIKILDVDWLKKFQSREIDLRPGDALKSYVQVIADYASEGEVVTIKHNVLEVEKVIKVPPPRKLFEE